MPPDVRFKAKMHKIRLPLGLSDPTGEAYSASQTVFSLYSRRLTFKGRDGGRGKEEGKGRGGVGNEGEGPAPKYFACLEPPVSVSFARWRGSTREK